MNDNQLKLVTFEQADRLDKLGFDWPTRSRYDYGCEKYVTEVSVDRDHNNPRKWTNGDKQGCSAPTVALALKWMREVKDLKIYYIFYRHTGPLKSGYVVYLNYGNFSECVDSYEAAESILLNELLKVIENE